VISDVLLVLAAVALVVGVTLIYVPAGVIVFGLACAVGAVALSDGKGVRWRS
jgi:uncharacterized membrane protein